jgi:two-component system NarL family sensor kinase
MGDLDVLNAVAEALGRVEHVGEALEDILRRLAELLHLDSGWVWLMDEDSERFFRGASYALPEALAEPIRMSGAECWCMLAFRRGALEPQNVSVLACSRLREAGTTGHHASVPLVFQGRRLGIMNLTAGAGRALSASELRLLATVGAQLGLALERERLAEEGRKRARAEERARMAREVHDTLAQRLTVVGLSVEGAMDWLERDPGRARRLLERALEVTREGIEEVRAAVRDMRVSALAGRPLGEALAALARGFTADSGVPVTLEVAAEAELPLRMEAELFRIAQEALTNVMRHAAARQVWISLAVGGKVRLSIRDDGRGISEGSDGGHGLTGMRERARLLGGTLRITRRPGGGTRITVTAPT